MRSSNAGCARWRCLDVKLALDDSGIGYPSWSYPQKFRFTKLKIGQTFVCDLDEDLNARSVMQAIIAISRSPGLAVTAEAGEREQQMACLRQEGRGLAKGYLLSYSKLAASLHWTTRPVDREPDQLSHNPHARHLPATGDRGIYGMRRHGEALSRSSYLDSG